MIVSKKNRMENGIRADFIGSNPHSKGESLSRSIDDRWESIKAVNKTTIGTIEARVNTNILINIFL